jgi:hypothetical protein
MDPKFRCEIVYNPKPNYLFYLCQPYASHPNSKFIKVGEFCWVQTCFLGLNPVTGVEMHITATIPSFFIDRLEQNQQKKQQENDPKPIEKQMEKITEPNQHENLQIQNATETKQQEKQTEKQKPQIQKEDESKKDLIREISLK